MLRMIFFDTQKECKELKERVREDGIVVVSCFFEWQSADDLLEIVQKYKWKVSDCLLITNQESHRQMAWSLGMAVVGCIEEGFEIPKTEVLLESLEEISVHYLNKVYCHANGLPAKIVETKRCYIRELTKEDIGCLYEILEEEEVAKFLPKKLDTKEEEIQKWVQYVSFVYSFFEYGYWGVFFKETNELIGKAGFQEGSCPLEAGYVIKSDFWGNGLATEILSALIVYAKEELDCNEVIVRIEETNIASLKVAKKCGFYDTKQEEIVEQQDSTQRRVKIFQCTM